MTSTVFRLFRSQPAPKQTPAQALGDAAPAPARKALDRAVGASGFLTVMSDNGEVVHGPTPAKLVGVDADQVRLVTDERVVAPPECNCTVVELRTGKGVVLFRVPARPQMEAGAEVALPLPTQVERQERRRFARVPVEGEAGIAIPGEMPLGARLESLSGGGASVIAPREFLADQIVLLSFSGLSGVRFDALRCRVVRSRATHQGQWHLGLRFLNLTEAEEAAIVQLVYRVQVQASRQSR